MRCIVLDFFFFYTKAKAAPKTVALPPQETKIGGAQGGYSEEQLKGFEKRMISIV
jgi:hypothetical protein